MMFRGSSSLPPKNLKFWVHLSIPYKNGTSLSANLNMTFAFLWTPLKGTHIPSLFVWAGADSLSPNMLANTVIVSQQLIFLALEKTVMNSSARHLSECRIQDIGFCYAKGVLTFP